MCEREKWDVKVDLCSSPSQDSFGHNKVKKRYTEGEDIILSDIELEKRKYNVYRENET